MDLDQYRAGAERFLEEIDREHYLHFAGHKPDFEIEAIYDRHAALFSREAVDQLREAGNRELLDFSVQGFMGQAVKAEEAELARREASLSVTVGGEEIPFRQAPVVLANETDRERRAAIEDARIEVLDKELNPLLREMLDRSRELTRELGWRDMNELCEELSGLDLAALRDQTSAFLAETEDTYEPLVEPELRRHLGLGFYELRRADLPAFFRAPSLDASFPAKRMMDALRQTLTGLGIDIDSQPNVTVDADQRPTKSPRAFCSPIRVPDEVCLVIAPVGGRDDYEALFHEAGHTEHFAHVDGSLPFERRFLGDNSFTEAFAFLFQYLTHEPAWLGDVLGIDGGEIAGYSRAVKLMFLRRYSAKLDYELLLHGPGAAPADYTARLDAALHVEHFGENWLSDVDPFFYAARYLRAWAVERSVRAHLEERFGERWFADPEAGEVLRGIWKKGQRTAAEELLEELGAPPAVDFGVLVP